jgi:hypothetical protein
MSLLREPKLSFFSYEPELRPAGRLGARAALDAFRIAAAITVAVAVAVRPSSDGRRHHVVTALAAAVGLALAVTAVHAPTGHPGSGSCRHHVATLAAATRVALPVAGDLSAALSTSPTCGGPWQLP